MINISGCIEEQIAPDVSLSNVTIKILEFLSYNTKKLKFFTLRESLQRILVVNVSQASDLVNTSVHGMIKIIQLLYVKM